MTDKHMKSMSGGLMAAVALTLTAQLPGCGINSNDNLLKARAAMAIAEAETSPTASHGSTSHADRKPDPEQDLKPGARNQTDHQERNRRILYFGAGYCPACRLAEESLKRLSEAGWQVGPEPTNHIQTFSIDSPDPKTRNRARELGIQKIPTWILWVAGRERERVARVLDPFEVGELFKKDGKRSGQGRRDHKAP